MGVARGTSAVPGEADAKWSRFPYAGMSRIRFEGYRDAPALGIASQGLVGPAPSAGNVARERVTWQGKVSNEPRGTKSNPQISRIGLGCGIGIGGRREVAVEDAEGNQNSNN